MPILHLLLALIVIVIWGLNFIFVELALHDISPLLLCTLRFVLASLPALFFVKPPKTPLKYLLLYGLITFGVQFSLLFMGMYAGMSPGLASLLMQLQVFFSLLFALIFLNENPNGWQIIGALVSFMGIGLVWIHLEGHSSLLGFILIIGASAAWGFGNFITKKIGSVNMMGLVVWGSFVASFPLAILTLGTEGPQHIMASLHQLSGLGFISVLFIVYGSTWAGYGIWNWLLSRHPVSTVVPFTLLVPVVAMLSSIVFLHEAFEFWKLKAGILVITGLCINLIAVRFFVKPKVKLDAA